MNAKKENYQDQNNLEGTAISALLDETEKQKPVKKSMFGKRVKFGLVLMLIAVAALLYSIFFLGSTSAESINANAVNIDNNNKLVHITGELSSAKLTDPLFNISAEGVMLERVVETYEQTENGGEWKQNISEKDVEEGFKNPEKKALLSSERWTVEAVKLGVFSLSPKLEGRATVAEPLPVTEADYQKLNPYGQKAFKLIDGHYLFGVDPLNPRVGDMRISFRVAPAGMVSVLAKQQGSSLVAYRDNGAIIEELMRGNRSLEQMSYNLDLGGSSLVMWAVSGGAVLLLIIGLFVTIGKRSGRSGNQPEQRVEEQDNFAVDSHEDFAEEEGHYDDEAGFDMEKETHDFMEDDIKPVIENPGEKRPTFDPIYDNKKQVQTPQRPKPEPIQALEFDNGQPVINFTSEWEQQREENQGTEESSNTTDTGFEDPFAHGDEPKEGEELMQDQDYYDEDDSDELPSGVEMITPDQISEEEAAGFEAQEDDHDDDIYEEDFDEDEEDFADELSPENYQAPDLDYTGQPKQEYTPEPEPQFDTPISDSYEDDIEMPDGVEMVTPETAAAEEITLPDDGDQDAYITDPTDSTDYSEMEMPEENYSESGLTEEEQALLSPSSPQEELAEPLEFNIDEPNFSESDDNFEPEFISDQEENNEQPPADAASDAPPPLPLPPFFGVGDARDKEKNQAMDNSFDLPNIPDDFDPSAEMEAPAPFEPAHDEENELVIDTGEDDESPFVIEEENK